MQSGWGKESEGGNIPHREFNKKIKFEKKSERGWKVTEQISGRGWEQEQLRRGKTGTESAIKHA